MKSLKNSFPLWSLIAMKMSLIALAAGVLPLAARAYYSDHLLVLAEGGRKTIADYDRLLTDAIRTNPWNGPAHLRKADLLLSQGKVTDSLRVLQAASPGVHNWNGWERQGAARERIAFGAEGTQEDVAVAAKAYDRVLAVYPTYERGIERRAVLALKAGEWDVVEKLAAQLQELDANNPNVTYMRARAAEALDNHDLAAHLYSQLSAGNVSSTGSLFTSEDIVYRLENVGRPNQ